MATETKNKSGFCIQSGKKVMKMVARNSECWDITAKLTFFKMAFDPYEIGNCNRKPQRSLGSMKDYTLSERVTRKKFYPTQ